MAYSDVVLVDTPYLYWRLEESTGPTAADSSGNGRTGTYGGSPTFSQSPLITDGNSILFSSSGQYVLNSAVVNSATATVEVWFDYSGTPPAERSLICGFNEGNGSGVGEKHLVLRTDGRVHFGVYDGAQQAAISADPLTAGVSHLVGVIDDAANIAYIYVNGQQAGTDDATTSFTGYTNPNILLAGFSTALSGSEPAFVSGKRDEFAVYDYALSSTRIAAHYAAGVAYSRIRTPKRLVGPTLVTNSPVTGYTVPANYITRMRHVHISNPSGSPVDMTLSIGTDAAATRLLDGKPIAADSVYEMACDEALAAGEIVQMSASSTNVLTITISGEEWVPA